MESVTWFSVFEFPFLAICVIFAFLTANALKGGVFGEGMTFLAWGFLVMAVGHFHMQAEFFLDFDLFASIFGDAGGTVAWVVALIVTWTLSGIGFYRIYRASKGE